MYSLKSGLALEQAAQGNGEKFSKKTFRCDTLGYG